MNQNPTYTLSAETFWRTNNFEDEHPDWTVIADITDTEFVSNGDTAFRDFLVVDRGASGVTPGVYLLTDIGLWYAENPTSAASFTLKQSIDDYTLLRQVLGIGDGKGVTASRIDLLLSQMIYDDDFASGLGSKSHETDFYSPPMDSGRVHSSGFEREGVWTTSVGRDGGSDGAMQGEQIRDVDNTFGQYEHMVGVTVDLGQVSRVDAVDIYVRWSTSDSSKGAGRQYTRYFDEGKNAITIVEGTTTGPFTSWTLKENGTGVEGVRYIFVGYLYAVKIADVGTIDAWLDDMHIEYTPSSAEGSIVALPDHESGPPTGGSC
jgi:hypothetical protein